MAKPPKKNFSGKSGQRAEKRPFDKTRPARKDGRDRMEKAAPRPKKSSFEHKAAQKPGAQNVKQNMKEPRPPRLKADLFGFHAVREAWKNPKRYVHALYLTEAAAREFEKDLATTAKRPDPTIVGKEDLDRAFPPGTVHQGVALSCQPLAEIDLMDIIIKAQGKDKSVIVMLDQVTDPHNIGAILRSACAFGADGVVMQSKHTPESTGILAKTACGAVEHMPVAYETNLSRALEKLQEHHYTIIGLDEHAPKTFSDLYAYDRVVIVLGAEGPGLRRLIREHCDVLVTLPTRPPIASLNVSNAAAVALYALTA